MSLPYREVRGFKNRDLIIQHVSQISVICTNDEVQRRSRMGIGKALLASSLITLLVMAVGCTSSGKAILHVYSNPPGCAVALDGREIGVTPTSVELGYEKKWKWVLGRITSPESWEYSGDTYEIACFPPKDAEAPQQAQKKNISTVEFHDERAIVFSF